MSTFPEWLPISPPDSSAWERALIQRIQPLLAGDCTGHDFYHSLRVRQLACLIAKEERLDATILVAAAFLHDIGRGAEGETKRDHVEVGISTARAILPEVGFPLDKVDHVIHCVQHHEEYAWAKQAPAVDLTREALAFQDADRLDALGAVGIARCFAYAGACGIPIWEPSASPDAWTHGQLSSTAFTHLQEKLLRLRDHMNTQTGRQLAVKRHDFIVRFIDQFREECDSALSNPRPLGGSSPT